MTALAQYAKLEAEARYFDGVSAQPQNVVVSFGERSLIIMGFNDVAIAHWPLASLRALGQRNDSAVQLVPHPESDERLVITDRQMLTAIGKVCPDLYQRKVDRKGVGRALIWAGGAVMSPGCFIVSGNSVFDRSNTWRDKAVCRGDMNEKQV